MALLKPTKASVKKQIRITLSTSTIEEARNYCQWANIQTLDDFFELVSQFIFHKDSEWKKHKASNKN